MSQKKGAKGPAKRAPLAKKREEDRVKHKVPAHLRDLISRTMSGGQR